MKKSTLKLIWQLVYIFGTMVLIYFLGFADAGFQNLGESLKDFDLNWLLLAGACVLAFWFFQTCVFHTCSKFMGEKLTFRKNLKIAIIGEYYSAVTPFSTGGQPMQLGYYKRYGVPVAKSTCILVIRLIGFTASLCIIYLLAVIFWGHDLFANNVTVKWLSLLGFAINAASVVFLALLLINKRLVERIGRFFIRLVCKIKFLKKHREHWLESFKHGVEDFSQAARYMKENKWGAVGMMFFSLLSIAFLYSISYCVYRAMGLQEADFFLLFSMQIMLYLSVAFVPTPGAIGASEGGFYLFFAGVFPQESLYLGMMLWRFFTYYSNLLVGAVVVISDEVYYMIKRRHGEAAPPTVAQEINDEEFKEE